MQRVLAAVLLLSGPWVLADAGGDSAQVLARAQALLKQVASEKAAAEAELAKVQADTAIRLHQSDQQIAALKKALNDKDAALQAAQAGLAESTRSNASLGGELGRTRTRLQQTEDRLREVVGKYRELAGNFQQSRTRNADLEHRLDVQTRIRKDAESRNAKLYQLGIELLGKFEHKGPMDALLQHEPFTGIKEVRMENVEEDYRYKLEQLKLRQGAADGP